MKSRTNKISSIATPLFTIKSDAFEGEFLTTKVYLGEMHTDEIILT